MYEDYEAVTTTPIPTPSHGVIPAGTPVTITERLPRRFLIRQGERRTALMSASEVAACTTGSPVAATLADLDATDDAADWVTPGHVLDRHEVEFLRSLNLPGQPAPKPAPVWVAVIEWGADYDDRSPFVAVAADEATAYALAAREVADFAEDNRDDDNGADLTFGGFLDCFGRPCTANGKEWLRLWRERYTAAWVSVERLEVATAESEGWIS